MKTELYIEYAGKQILGKTISDTAKEIWKSEGKKVKDLEKMELYFKPDENKCYYKFNDVQTGEFNV